jgi:hypothetical protein
VAGAETAEDVGGVADSSKERHGFVTGEGLEADGSATRV